MNDEDDPVAEAVFTEESGTVERLNAFTAAVVSIAIILLALNLPMRTGHTTAEWIVARFAARSARLTVTGSRRR
jgi:uncharacterized membrane protein